MRQFRNEISVRYSNTDSWPTDFYVQFKWPSSTSCVLNSVAFVFAVFLNIGNIYTAYN